MNYSIEKIIRDNMTEGMLQIDGHGSVLFVNDAALSILEMERSEVFGKKIGLLFLGSEQNDDFFQLILNAFAVPEKTEQAVVIIKAGEKLKYLKAVARSEILFDGENSHSLLATVCFQDVSSYVKESQLEEEITKMNQLNSSLEKRNRLIRKIFGKFIVRDEEFGDVLTTDCIKELNSGLYKDMTVIQSDLRGYTAMSFAMTSEDLLCILNYYISQMAEVIVAHHGVIVELLGDGIVSTFGTLGHEDTQCEDAIAAAVEMQQRMPVVNAWIREHHYDTYLKMGIGIDCGSAIVGFVGNDELKAFDAMGEVIGKADNIQSNTIEGDIFISERVRNSISVELEIGKSFHIPADKTGKTEQVFQVKGIGAPFNLRCPVIKSNRTSLKEPRACGFYVLNGKIREDAVVECAITEFSDNELRMSCGYDMELFTNIILDIGDFLYGKIIEKDKNSYVVSFTAVPSCFAEWRDELPLCSSYVDGLANNRITGSP